MQKYIFRKIVWNIIFYSCVVRNKMLHFFVSVLHEVFIKEYHSSSTHFEVWVKQHLHGKILVQNLVQTYLCTCLKHKFESYHIIKHVWWSLGYRGLRVMVFNATFNNISVISLWPVLLVEETGVPRQRHQSLTDFIT